MNTEGDDRAMQSVETQGNTVDEATAVALTELRTTIDKVDVDVIRPARRGLFGAGRKAVVRVTRRAVPTEDEGVGGAPLREAAEHTLPPGIGRERADDEQRPNESAGGSQLPEEEIAMTEGDVTTQEPVDIETLTPEQRVELLDQECELAADFVEGLLDLLDLPGDIEIEVTEDGAVVNVSDVGSGLLIGRRGATLDALQELVRSTTQRQTERRSHVRIDVEGYRARQLDKLRAKCREAIAQVRESGEPYKLEPMDAYERKMMHNLVARAGGVTSSSEGAEPKRRVVILPE